MTTLHSDPLISKIKPEELSDKKKRVILIGDSDHRKRFNKFPNNKITTTKYNLLSWLPKSIMLQFRRVANIYFLIISILNFFYFSPKNPISMVVTFGIILLFSSIREGVEDYQRYKKDKKANEKKYVYYNDKNFDTKGFEYKHSKKIHVGEIMKIFHDEEVPADICILKSSNLNGISFVDTVNLDGESNLKDKKCNQKIQAMTDLSLCNLTAILKCDQPNQQLEYWEGYLTIFSSNEPLMISLDQDQLLLKGSYVKNTDYIIGVVVYTGHESKIMQNTTLPRGKVSKFMKTINRILYTVLVFQMLICLIFAYFSLQWQLNHLGQFSYIKIAESNNITAYFARVGTFLISYSQLIPISMYLFVEIIRLFQSPLIKYDKNVFDFNSNKPSLARTSELPDELGQVNYILSDKTGTLTKNNMVLEHISIEDKIYSIDEISKYFKFKYNFKDYSNENNLFKESKSDERIKNDCSNLLNRKNVFSNKTSNSEGKEESSSDSSSSSDKEIQLINNYGDGILSYENNIIDFFRLVNICNSIVINCEKRKDDKSGLIYQSTSIDELALEKGSTKCGISLQNKTINKIEINYFNEFTEIWEIIAILPFNSERKRMTVIVQSPNGQIHLFSKGADEVIFSRFNNFINLNNNLNPNGLDKHSPLLLKYKEINDIFAKQGLRTLIMGKKLLTSEEFEAWIEKHNEIINDMNLNHLQKQDKLSELFEEIEMNMTYMGCSAIEDKLQDDVEDTIRLLKEAGIKICMLTGDKIENSIEVAKMCNLITQERCVNFTLRYIKTFQEFQENIQIIFDLINKEINYCLIIDGKTLSYFEKLEENEKNNFIEIFSSSTSAICCRLTPKQKSQMVRILKKYKGKVTLCVGDGANDVPMILESNVGIGISGKEGTQAVRSADYSISQFKFLKDILLVHGRLSYKRLSSYMCYAFYKNIIVVFAEIYFIVFNGFSGQIYFSDWFTNFYNTFWSSWPMIINFTLDRDVDRELSIKYPVLYRAGHVNRYMNPKVFFSWILFAIVHGATIFWIPMLINHYSVDFDGKTKDHWWTSSLSFMILIHIVHIKLFLETEHWNILSLLGAFASLLCFYICLYIFSIGSVAAVMSTRVPDYFWDYIKNYKALILLLLVPFVALMPDFTIKFFQKICYLQPADIIYRMENNKAETIEMSDSHV